MYRTNYMFYIRIDYTNTKFFFLNHGDVCVVFAFLALNVVCSSASPFGMLTTTFLRYSRRIQPTLSSFKPSLSFSTQSEPESSPQNPPPEQKKGLFSFLKLPKFLLKENIVAKEGFNR